MAHTKIEMNRGLGWESRGEGEQECTLERFVAYIESLSSLQYAHRGYFNGELVVTCERPFGRRGKARTVRHDRG